MTGVSLEGELVLVTGEGQGLGAATSRVLASAGAHLAVADVHLERAGVDFTLPVDLLGFTHALHAELRPNGIRVCAVVALPTQHTSWP